MTSEPWAALPDRPDRKVYALTVAGQQRAADWLTEVSWPKPGLAEFHLKLIAAAAARLADPITIVDAQRRELLRRLRAAQRAAMAEPDRSDAALLLEGIVLRLQADLRWLEALLPLLKDAEEGTRFGQLVMTAGALGKLRRSVPEGPARADPAGGNGLTPG